MGFSIGKALGSVAKVAAAPFTAGASLSGGSVSDIFKNGASNVSAGILSGVTGGDTSSLLSNIVQGAVGLLGDYGQSILNVQNQKDLAAYTAARQNELNEAAFNRNLYQWNLENQYNSPAAQMQRYAEAGLNPNLIYGQQNLSAGSPELKPATYDPGEYQPVDHSAQRQALKIALLEHAQRIENQAIQNDLARQELALRIKASEREDEKLNLLKSRAVNLTNPTDWDNYWDKVEKDEYQRLRNAELRQKIEGNTGLPGFFDTMWKAGKSAANLVKKGNYIERASQKFRKY